MCAVYKLHCPKFSNFVAGDEYRLDQSEAHGKYLDQLEGLLEGKLGEFMITAGECEEAKPKLRWQRRESDSDERSESPLYVLSPSARVPYGSSLRYSATISNVVNAI